MEVRGSKSDFDPRDGPATVDDPVQLQRGTDGAQDVAEVGGGELVGRFVINDQDRLDHALDRRVDTNTGVERAERGGVEGSSYCASSRSATSAASSLKVFR